MEFSTFGILFKTFIMKLRILLFTFCLLGIGLFSKAQTKQTRLEIRSSQSIKAGIIRNQSNESKA
jgi:hypothetical protein